MTNGRSSRPRMRMVRGSGMASRMRTKAATICPIRPRSKLGRLSNSQWLVRVVDSDGPVADLTTMATLHRYRVFEIAHGIAAIAWSGDAVTAFRLPGESARDAEWSLLRRLPDAVAGDPPPAIAAVAAD